jgi:hypothetical protein
VVPMPIWVTSLLHGEESGSGANPVSCLQRDIQKFQHAHTVTKYTLIVILAVTVMFKAVSTIPNFCRGSSVSALADRPLQLISWNRV